MNSQTDTVNVLRLDLAALFAVGYVGLTLFAQWLSLSSGHHATLVLSNGLYTAALVLSDRRTWPKWAAIVFAAELFILLGIYHESMAEALIDAVCHASGALVGVHLVRICRSLPLQLNTLADVLVFSAACGLAGPAVSLGLNILLSVATGNGMPGSEWLAYWTGTAAGTVVLAPLLLTLHQHARAWRTVPVTRWLEAGALFGVLFITLHLIFSSRLPTVYLALPLILWAAVRMGTLGINAVMLVFLLIIVRYSASGVGPYGASVEGRVLLSQSFLVLASVSANCLAVIIAQYQQAQIGLRRAHDELELRVAERTSALAERTTALAASEQRLRDSNTLFAVARGAARIIILDWHVTTDTLTYSDDPTWLRGPLPTGGKYPLLKDQVHPNDRERFLTMRRLALETLQGRAFDYRIVRTDGIVLWVQSNQTLFAGADGKAERLVSTTQDISARKQIEASMGESEQRLRALLDGIPDRAWLKDAAGRFIAVNRATEEGYALPASKLIGKTIFDIRAPHVAECIAAEDRMAMARGGQVRFERRSFVTGTWVEITKLPIFGADGSPSGVVGIWRDITMRKAAEEEALRDSEERYRTLVNVTSQSIWILDGQGNLKSIIKTITGEHPGTVMARNWLSYIHKDDRAATQAALQKAIDTNSTYEHEHRIVDRNGHAWDVLARAVPVMNPDGSVREWIGTSTDVSQRKVAERELQGLNQTLRRLSGRREELLEAERARIAQNLHDGVGQSLNVVRLKLAAMVAMAVASRATHDTLPTGTVGVPQAAALAEIQNIIDQVNLEIRSLEFELSPPVLRQLGLVAALGWLGDEMHRSYGLTVSVSDDGEDKPLDQTHRAVTFRAVRELLINVAKHAKVNTAHVDAQRLGGDVVVTVSDMGAGFDASDIGQVETGGLGLAGVRERIEFAGGRVRLNSAPGAGTVGSITMPLKEDAQ